MRWTQTLVLILILAPIAACSEGGKLVPVGNSEGGMAVQRIGSVEVRAQAISSSLVQHVRIEATNRGPSEMILRLVDARFEGKYQLNSEFQTWHSSTTEVLHNDRRQFVRVQGRVRGTRNGRDATLGTIRLSGGDSIVIQLFLYDFAPEGAPRVPFPEEATVIIPVEYRDAGAELRFQFKRPPSGFSLFRLFET